LDYKSAPTCPLVIAISELGGSPMPVLSFLCPTARTYFDSGVRLDEKSAAASRLTIVTVGCPECSREHRFLLADGVFDAAQNLNRASAAARRRQLSTSRFSAQGMIGNRAVFAARLAP
jgi:hypothetical protein